MRLNNFFLTFFTTRYTLIKNCVLIVLFNDDLQRQF